MKSFKENVRIIIGFIIGVVLASSIAVYAAVNASDVSYTRAGTNIKSVEQALNDLYSKKGPYGTWKDWLKILEEKGVKIESSSTETENMIVSAADPLTSKASAFNGVYPSGKYDYRAAWVPLRETSDDYIGYVFNKPVMLYKMSLNYSSYESSGEYSFVLEGKTAQNSWEQIGDEYIINTTSSQHKISEYDIDSDKLYYGYRIKNNYSTTGHGCEYWHLYGEHALAIGELQFYCVDN